MLQIKVHSRYNFITFAKMKQWLMILALCWAAATVNAAGTPAPAIRIRPHRPSENAAYARPAYAGPIGIFII